MPHAFQTSNIIVSNTIARMPRDVPVPQSLFTSRSERQNRNGAEFERKRKEAISRIKYFPGYQETTVTYAGSS